LKRGLRPVEHELGIHVCGGRGKHSRQTPHELLKIGDRVGFNGEKLADASRLVAKVDSAAVQDGFDLYLHDFIVTDDANWLVVQQGMNAERRQARRYHWLSAWLKDFVNEPHAAIEGEGYGEIINLTDRRAAASRDAQIDLLTTLGPDGITKEVAALNGIPKTSSAQPLLPHLIFAGAQILTRGLLSEAFVDNVALSERKPQETAAGGEVRAPPSFSQSLQAPSVNRLCQSAKSSPRPTSEAKGYQHTWAPEVQT
jgi:hypothetical protein